MFALLAGSAFANDVVTLEVDGAIGVATAEYLVSGLEHARDTNAELVVVRIDTPGGLVNSTRDIIKAMLASPVPVAVYVAPDGARADSAGTYILLASHVAAMAPTTHLGAATPVSITGDDVGPRDLEDLHPEREEPAEGRGDDDGEEEDESVGSERREPGTAMDSKVLNDAVAYIRALAERHGRNADWAEESVRNAATLTAREALAQNVVEFLADDEEDLLRQLHGYEVRVGAESVTLDTEDATLVAFEPGWRIKLLSVISNPEIVLILGMIGLYGLMYEGWNPGAIVPGVVGVICLLLAAYALQIIPVNYAGLALIVVGLALMTAEAFAPSFGALGLGGVAAFVFGAIMMFDSGIPGFGISVAFVSLLGVLAALAIGWLVRYLLKLQKRGAVSGRSSIVGGTGIAMENFTGNGRIWLEGEAWAAYSEVPLSKDQDVVVTSMEGLTLYVRPAPVQRPNTQLQT